MLPGLHRVASFRPDPILVRIFHISSSWLEISFELNWLPNARLKFSLKENVPPLLLFLRTLFFYQKAGNKGSEILHTALSYQKKTISGTTPLP